MIKVVSLRACCNNIKGTAKALCWFNYSAILRQIPPVLSSGWRKIDLKIQLFPITLILLQKTLKKVAIVLLGLLITNVGAGQSIIDGCPSRPNCVSSMASGKHAIEPILLEGAQIQAVIAQLESILKKMGLEEIQVDGFKISAVAISSVFGFKDDVTIYLDPNSQLIHLRSASRTGYYDFGQNRNRIERLREYFKGAGRLNVNNP